MCGELGNEDEIQTEMVIRKMLEAFHFKIIHPEEDYKHFSVDFQLILFQCFEKMLTSLRTQNVEKYFEILCK